MAQLVVLGTVARILDVVEVAVHLVLHLVLGQVRVGAAEAVLLLLQRWHAAAVVAPFRISLDVSLVFVRLPVASGPRMQEVVLSMGEKLLGLLLLLLLLRLLLRSLLAELGSWRGKQREAVVGETIELGLEFVWKKRKLIQCRPYTYEFSSTLVEPKAPSLKNAKKSSLFTLVVVKIHGFQLFPLCSKSVFLFYLVLEKNGRRFIFK